MTSLLADRGAVVVGGSRGIGAAVAALLAQHGAGVVINGRDAGAARSTAQAITAAGGRAVAHPGSPSDQETAESLVDNCIDEFDGIHILINCAGIAEPAGSSILDISAAQFAELMDAHLGTVFATCRAAAPKMIAQGGGSIVNSSSFAFLGDYGGTGYPAGKGAVNSLTLAIAAELKEHRVRANVVCPGARTRLSTGADYVAHIHELNRRGLLNDATMQGSLDVAEPDYAAPTYVYLASDLAKERTGEIFAASGGFVGRFPKATPDLIGYRNHHDAPPWSVGEISALVDGGAA
ncbi:MAG TPA: SDR family oxidoreductase [Mycobacterium sp.]|nr:SDR family oxidoreductase [Mycobacterium sp.]